MEPKSIERFFLLNLLRITLTGVSVILITDILYADDSLSIIIDFVIVSACLFAFVVRKWSYNASVLVITGISLIAMLYQWANGINLTTSMAVILLLGFIFSMLLRGPLMWGAHAVTGIAILVVIYAQAYLVKMFAPTLGDMATVAITYFVLYFIISYCTGVLKMRYDQQNQALQSANLDLVAKANEIEAQHEELLQSHESVNEMNRNLEKLVDERTAKVKAQNEMLLKYTYTNAHHLRGPVARLLGLITVHKLETNPDYNFFFSKIEDQANEIDSVVKQINAELEK